MIYFLRDPETDHISIRYYRTVGLYYANSEYDGLEALAVQKGSREAMDQVERCYMKYRGATGTYYFLGGDLDRRLGWPRTLRDMSDSEMAAMYSMPRGLVNQSKRRADIKKITRQNASRVYDACMQIVRARKSGGLG